MHMYTYVYILYPVCVQIHSLSCVCPVYRHKDSYTKSLFMHNNKIVYTCIRFVSTISYRLTPCLQCVCICIYIYILVLHIVIEHTFSYIAYLDILCRYLYSLIYTYSVYMDSIYISTYIYIYMAYMICKQNADSILLYT